MFGYAQKKQTIKWVIFFSNIYASKVLGKITHKIGNEFRICYLQNVYIKI